MSDRPILGRRRGREGKDWAGVHISLDNGGRGRAVMVDNVIPLQSAAVIAVIT